MFVNFVLLALASLSDGSIIPRHESITFSRPIEVEAGGISNIHIVYNRPVSGSLALHYGSCDTSPTTSPNLHHHLIGRTTVGDHPLARRHSDHPFQQPERFVWIVPSDAPSEGCLNAYSGSELLGCSSPITVKARTDRRNALKKRDGIVLADVSIFTKSLQQIS